MNTIKWFLFDVGGVIVHLAMKNPEGYMFKTRFFDQKDLEGFFFTKEYIDYMRGDISHEQLIGRYLAKKKLDLSVAEFDELFKKDITPMKGMVSLFEKLEKKYKIALATNEGKMLAKYKIEGSGVVQYLSKIVPSYLLREIKPSPAFYKKTLKRIGATANECVFIDDKLENVKAAQSLGMTGIVFTNTLQLEKDLHALQLL